MGRAVKWLLTLLLLGCGASMLDVYGGDHVVFVGDSNTAGGWFVPAVDAINAAFLPVTRRRFAQLAPGAVPAVNTGTRGRVQPVTTAKSISYVNSGVGGNKSANIAAAVPARITDFNPTIVVMQIGINDLTNPPPMVTPAEFRANLDSIWTDVLAAIPSCRLVGVSLFMFLENWEMDEFLGPRWAGPYDSPADPSIDQFNAQVQASVESFGGTYVSTRERMLLYEVANNTPEPGADDGFLTGDGLHLTAAGEQLASDCLMDHVTVHQ